MYCRHCGKEIKYNVRICEHCKGTQYIEHKKYVEEGEWGYRFLGFFAPIVGIILYFVWSDKNPYAADNLGKGAIANIAIGVVFFIIKIMLM